MQVLQRRIEGMRAAGRAVVLAGDLNIAYAVIDHCDYCDAPDRVQAAFLKDRPDRCEAPACVA